MSQALTEPLISPERLIEICTRNEKDELGLWNLFQETRAHFRSRNGFPPRLVTEHTHNKLSPALGISLKETELLELQLKEKYLK